jgi:hypothetical protein
LLGSFMRRYLPANRARKPSTKGWGWWASVEEPLQRVQRGEAGVRRHWEFANETSKAARGNRAKPTLGELDAQINDALQNAP